MTIKFNKQQIVAVNHKQGPAMVVAGAGSGKSTVLVHRISELIKDGVRQNDIVAITFTRNSADDLKQKLNSLGILDVRVGTFHSVLGRMLIDRGINVNKQVNRFDVEKMLRSIDRNVNVEDVLSFISYQKCYMRGVNDEFVYKDSDYSDIKLRDFYKGYEHLKTATNTYDFDDYMLEAYKVLKTDKNAFRCEYLLVDEHQDNNLIQNLLIKEMCPNGNIMVIGDYRQSLYEFRGGKPSYFMNFDKEYANTSVIHLDYNYRSCANIVEGANHFIKGFFSNYEHYSNSIPANTSNGEIQIETSDDEIAEAALIADKIQSLILSGENLNEIAVVYRLNSMTANIEIELAKRKIAYYVENDANFFKSKHIVPIISMLRLVEDKNDDEALVNLFKSRVNPFTFVPNSALGALETYAYNNSCSYIDAIPHAPIDPRHKTAFMTLAKNINLIATRYSSGEINTEDVVSGVIALTGIEGILQSKHAGEDLQNKMNGLGYMRGISKTNNIVSIIKLAYETSKLSRKESDNAVKLLTIHKSQGLEWDNVFVVGLNEGKFPNDKATTVLSEAMLFYVAVTRPKKFLCVSQVGQYNSFVDIYLKNNLNK